MMMLGAHACKCLNSNDCRCLYSTAPIVLLDAPFTAIDNRLKQSIMEKVATILTRLRLIFFINANSIVTIIKRWFWEF